MQSFKQFFTESGLTVNWDEGRSEISRLERGHYLFIMPTSYKMAGYFMRGHLTKNNFMSFEIASDFEKAISKLTPEQDTLVVVSFPKRWEAKLGFRRDIKELFANMFEENGYSAQYVWGMYSHWNPRIENHDEGHFYRNPNYHANDRLLNLWLEKHPSVTGKSEIPLNRQPRIMGQHLLDQGRHSFHGWREIELPST